MKVRVLFFSVLREVTGSSEVALELPPTVRTAAALLEHLYQKWPALRPWDGSLLVAINQAHAKRTDEVPDDAEVAVMPPVQGG